MDEHMKKKNFYFRDRYGFWRLLKENVNYYEAWNAMKDFLDKTSFRWYYTRVYTLDDGNTHFDVGSHTEFFIWGFEDA